MRLTDYVVQLEEQGAESLRQLQVLRDARTAAERALASTRERLMHEADVARSDEYRAGLERAMVLIDKLLA